MSILTEEIQRMIESALEGAEITSANPIHTNAVKQLNYILSPDLDAIIKEAQRTDTDEFKKNRDIEDTVTAVQEFRGGNVGRIQKLSTVQMSNITQFAANPFGFVTRSIFRKLFKGVGILFLIEIARQVADIILQEFFKPGRVFDTRFREEISKQVVKFLQRKEQQELKQGFKQVITTTIGGLRGHSLAGQIGGNFFNPERIPDNFIDNRTVVDDNRIAQNAQMRSGLSAARSRQGRRG